MTLTSQKLRYQLPKKAIKTDCPQCSPRHRKTLSRYVDTRTGETLPESFGRCDRESNCGYHLSPYCKGGTGISYAEEIFQRWKLSNPVPERQFSSSTNSRQDESPTPVYMLPDEVFTGSLGHYEENQFARLLSQQFGQQKAHELLQRFHVGTSTRWLGACVFWLKDEQQRVRAGQVVLFADDWHKARYIDREGNTKVCISSVSPILLQRYRQQNQAPPVWLTDYHDNAPRWPILFGLHQLEDAPINQPVAVVESPKTAVVCSALISGFIWMAAGALSYLNTERLAPLRGRKVMLYPDLSKDGKAFARWNKVADDLNANGYQISVSDLLERQATNEQKVAGLDLADFLLTASATVSTTAEHLDRTGSVLRPDESQIERLSMEPCDYYPAEWDKPNPPDAVPRLRQRSAADYFSWQQSSPPFNRLGLASLRAEKQATQ